MKRIFLLMLALSAAFIVGAQDFKYRLDNIESSDGEGFIDFYYGEEPAYDMRKPLSRDTQLTSVEGSHEPYVRH